MDNTRHNNILKITKIALFLFILGLPIVAKRITTWPIMTWAVYSTYSKGFPDSTASIVEVRVHSKSGESYVLKPSDIMPRGRTRIAKAVLNYAFESDDPNLATANRTYLAQTIPRILNRTDIESVEYWQITWDVFPLNVPPLDRDKPSSENLLGSFMIDDYINNKI
ncbi:hypothetical protein [Crocosphaera sp.]|uniref:hypothetical protein n=1 Tax=Crocosphaera sp. TaxID=2729996 RepID=UPI003F282F45|nr:hypothetical protein [Crocosphaera sp.]